MEQTRGVNEQDLLVKDELAKQIGIAKKMLAVMVVISIIVIIFGSIAGISYESYEMAMGVLWLFRITSVIFLALSIKLLIDLNKINVTGGVLFVIATSVQLGMAIIGLTGVLLFLIVWLCAGYGVNKMTQTLQELNLLEQVTTNNHVDYAQAPMEASNQEESTQLFERAQAYTPKKTSPSEVFGWRTIQVAPNMLMQATESMIDQQKIKTVTRTANGINYVFKMNWFGMASTAENIYTELEFEFLTDASGKSTVVYRYKFRNAKLSKIMGILSGIAFALLGLLMFVVSPTGGIIFLALAALFGIGMQFVWGYNRQEKYFNKHVLKRLETMVGIIYQNQQ